MKHIPNALTLANLFCGCCALLYTFYWQPEMAALFTAGSFVFDYLDGMVARALKVSSPLGKELDSLADVVSFGVVPGAMLYRMMSGDVSISAAFGNSFVEINALPAFVLSAFSALRLGKFNLDTRQTNYFIGLSTPACTVFVLGLALTAHHNLFGLKELIENQWFLYGLVGLLSWLLVSEIPMFGMKIKRFDWKSNVFNLIFLALLAVLVFFLEELALSAIIVCYILLSILFKKKIVADSVGS
ncbi:MAG: CDP-alcohol phosphatidyltransferase family protein [Saprospiraceae bacterium]|nr:CDP-alcohol phosphatidyltransferase family protein [Saprospiraceae bacterium]